MLTAVPRPAHAAAFEPCLDDVLGGGFDRTASDRQAHGDLGRIAHPTAVVAEVLDDVRDRLALLAESVVSCDDGAAEAVDVPARIGPEACAALGPKAVLLLQELVAGARSNSRLAARLDVDERAIGRRRARIRMVLARFAENRDPDVLP
jgi:hypothetical protein